MFLIIFEIPDIVVSSVCHDTGDVGVKGHREHQHVQGEQEPVVNELVVGCFGQTL